MQDEIIYTPDSIIQTEFGLWIGDNMLQGIWDRVDALDRAGRAEDAKALFREWC